MRIRATDCNIRTITHGVNTKSEFFKNFYACPTHLGF